MSCDLALDDLERIQALRDLRHMANREMRIIDERVRGIARASVSPKAAKWGQA